MYRLIILIIIINSILEHALGVELQADDELALHGTVAGVVEGL